MTKSGRPDEDGLIARYFRPLATAPGAARLLDDAASYRAPDGYELILTTDAIVAGVHFFADDPPDAVARKALRVNLSDLAAKGAAPAGYLLTIALTEDWSEDWLESFCEGLSSDQEEFGISLYGGDTVRTPGPLFISVTAFGLTPEGRVPRRTKAAVGQKLYVTGTIGDAALGLKIRLDSTLKSRWGLNAAETEHLLDRYLLPEPRLKAAALVAEFATAAMDVSDGLAGDLGKLCDVSGVSAEIEVARVPLSEAAASVVASEPAAIQKVLTGGDDYEIVCTVPAERLEAFRAAADSARVPVAEIGRIVDEKAPPRFLDRAGKPIQFKQTSFSHF
jgi:thiamine-monophosphate kinase